MYLDVAVIAGLVGITLCITFFVGFATFIYNDAKKQAGEASEK